MCFAGVVAARVRRAFARLRRRWTSLALSLALCAAFAPAGQGASVRLNLLSWGDYFDRRVLEEFAAETGVQVVYDVYFAAAALEAKLRAANDYDVAVAPPATLAALIRAGALRKLDKAKLPGAAGIDPQIRARLAAADPGNLYAVPYLWFTLGLAVDAERAKAAAESEAAAAASRRVGAGAAGAVSDHSDPVSDLATWQTIFRPERLAPFLECGVGIPDAPSQMFPIALRYLRLDPASQAPADLKRAADVLAPARKAGRTDPDVAGELAKGDVCLSVTSSAAALQARARALEAETDVDIRFALPREGAPVLIDSLVVPRAAAHGDAALAFIDFMLRPEIAARNSNATRLANAVPASTPRIVKEIARDPAIYPEPEAMNRLFPLASDPAAEKAMLREWTRAKTGKYP